MAMIKCPECGQEISDKAKKCVHCGAVLIPEVKKYCQECGTELETEAEICPNCGCPVEDKEKTENVPQQVEVTGVKIAGKSKKIIVLVALALLAAILIVVAVLQGQNCGRQF